MAERSLFFNALPSATSPTGYDRNYNADDLSDWLAMSCETGVVKDGLKVVASSGLTVNLSIGRAAIKGKGYINDAIKGFTITTNGTSTKRYDYIVLKLDNNINARTITSELRVGSSTIPTVSNLTRNDNVYELMLAYIEVGVGVSTISQTNIIDTRGDASLCPWFVAVKGYEDYYDAIIQTHESVITMANAGTQVITNLPSKLFNEKYSLIEVYTNGVKEKQSAYSVSTNASFIIVNFTTTKNGGAEILVKLDNFIDGEGMQTALEQYTQLLQEVENLNAAGEYNYICNGVNDNVLISNIVKAYLNGGTDYGTMKLNIIGNIGMTAAARGTGVASNPYGWFDLNVESNRRVILDFTRCGQIAPPIISGAHSQIFYTDYGIHIIGANVVASNTAVGTNIRIIGNGSGVIKFDECRFYITGYQDSLIAIRGTFNNCRGSVANSINNSYCFLPSSYGVVKIYGGEYYSYTGDSSKQSAIVGQSGADAVTIMYGVSAPTAARGGFYQTNSILQWTGGGVISCTDLISELPMVVVAGISNIRGTITKSKTYVW